MYNDINLIPRRQGKVSKSTLTIVVGMVVFLVVVVGSVCIYIPEIRKSILENKVYNTKDEILKLASVDAEYEQVLKKYNDYLEQNREIEVLKKSYLKTTVILEDLQKNVPGAIGFSNLVYEGRTVKITGICSSYKEIAQYIVKLRTIEYLDYSELSYINAVTDEKNSGEEKFAFFITLNLKSALDKTVEADDTATKTETPAVEGGE